MSEFISFVSNTDSGAYDPQIVEQASACLDRFTEAFNACDLAGMDAQLHFPHVMISGAELLVWDKPGNHPSDLFVNLRSTGWAFTRYESQVPVLASANKVHFLVTYTRRSQDGEEVSRHANLWVVVRSKEKWGIALRSY